MKTNKLKIIDALEINFVDSCCDDNLKLNTSNERPGSNKGTGEKRLYIGNTRDESEYDNFFEFNKLNSFFFKKNDLLDYLEQAKTEYLNPTQDYSSNIESFYDQNFKTISQLPLDIIKLKFHRTYDKQKRYYLVLDGNKSSNNPNRQAYSYLLKICLPRLTKINFVKFQNKSTSEFFIYIKPYFVNIPKIEKLNLIDINKKNEQETDKNKTRKLQSQYRLDLLDQMPYCVISEVADDRLLMACHIKPFSKCTTDEEFDKNNGVILTPTYHYLFDIGFISFDNDGKLIVSSFLSKLNQKRLHIKTGTNTKIKITSERKNFLEYHRQEIFQHVPEISEDDLVKWHYKG